MKTKFRLKYLEELRGITSKTCIKHNIPIAEAEHMLDQFMQDFAESLKDPRLPRVILPNIGVFKSTIGKLERSISDSEFFYGKDSEYAKLKREYLEPIISRIKAEGEGEMTWREWRGKEKKEEYEKKAQKEKLQREVTKAKKTRKKG